MVAGRLLSFWEGPFSGANMLVSGRANIYHLNSCGFSFNKNEDKMRRSDFDATDFRPRRLEVTLCKAPGL